MGVAQARAISGCSGLVVGCVAIPPQRFARVTAHEARLFRASIAGPFSNDLPLYRRIFWLAYLKHAYRERYGISPFHQPVRSMENEYLWRHCEQAVW
jgi:hypothetical protein